jgi:Family of unknown function (DUF5683)
MKMRSIIFIVSSLLFLSVQLHAQEKKPLLVEDDTAKVTQKDKPKPTNRYDSAMLAHSPRVAAIRSAILPGLGQIYNKKYWKLPIVYGALGGCGAVFAYNLAWYKRTRFAYTVLFNKDTASFSKVNPKLKLFITSNNLETLRYYRNGYRRDIDYSVLFFIILWGLNVVDATVDAHLKSFDVSPNLSIKVKPGYSDLARTNGLSIVMKIGK